MAAFAVLFYLQFSINLFCTFRKLLKEVRLSKFATP